MKRTMILFLCFIVLAALVGCGRNEPKDERPEMREAAQDEREADSLAAENEDSETQNDVKGTEPVAGRTESKNSADGIDVDLTALSSVMVYSEVYNMMVSPEDYIGKTVKMSGSFAYYKDETTGQEYFACIIQDATACCAQGIEFSPAGDLVYPDDYPAVDDTVTVTGTFEIYDESGIKFCILKDANLE